MNGYTAKLHNRRVSCFVEPDNGAYIEIKRLGERGRREVVTTTLRLSPEAACALMNVMLRCGGYSPSAIQQGLAMMTQATAADITPEDAETLRAQK